MLRKRKSLMCYEVSIIYRGGGGVLRRSRVCRPCHQLANVPQPLSWYAYCFSHDFFFNHYLAGSFRLRFCLSVYLKFYEFYCKNGNPNQNFSVFCWSHIDIHGFIFLWKRQMCPIDQYSRFFRMCNLCAVCIRRANWYGILCCRNLGIVSVSLYSFLLRDVYCQISQ